MHLLDPCDPIQCKLFVCLALKAFFVVGISRLDVVCRHLQEKLLLFVGHPQAACSCYLEKVVDPRHLQPDIFHVERLQQLFQNQVADKKRSRVMPVFKQAVYDRPIFAGL